MQLLKLLISERSSLKDANSFLNILGSFEHLLRILYPRTKTKRNHFNCYFQKFKRTAVLQLLKQRQPQLLVSPSTRYIATCQTTSGTSKSLSEFNAISTFLSYLFSSTPTQRYSPTRFSITKEKLRYFTTSKQSGLGVILDNTLMLPQQSE